MKATVSGKEEGLLGSFFLKGEVFGFCFSKLLFDLKLLIDMLLSFSIKL